MLEAYGMEFREPNSKSLAAPRRLGKGASAEALFVRDETWSGFAQRLAKRYLGYVETRVRKTAARLGGDERIVVDLEFDPTSKGSREAYAEKLFRARGDLPALGTVERSRQLLHIIGESFPTKRLMEAYFDNLETVLASKPRLAAPGKLVIGLGSGRSGSTTLAALLGCVNDSCSTHENPPLVYWRPEPEQIAFHFRRFEILRQYFSFVADSAHWWLTLIDDLVEKFPDLRFIGLVREPYECATSFARIKGFGRGSYNHWAAYPNGLWNPTVWDQTYPTFDTPGWAQRDPDRAKWDMILNYLNKYNEEMAAAAKRMPEKFLILRTENLNNQSYVSYLFNFIRCAPGSGSQKLRLNARTTQDGRATLLRY